MVLYTLHQMSDISEDWNIKYFYFFALISRQRAALSFAPQQTILSDFGVKWEAECPKSSASAYSLTCGIQREAEKIIYNIRPSRDGNKIPTKKNLFLLPIEHKIPTPTRIYSYISLNIPYYHYRFFLLFPYKRCVYRRDFFEITNVALSMYKYFFHGK